VIHVTSGVVALLEQRDGVLLVTAVPLLGVKQDASLSVAGLGRLVMWQRPFLVGGALVVAAGAWHAGWPGLPRSARWLALIPWSASTVGTRNDLEMEKDHLGATLEAIRPLKSA
jgi:hypothetical protein